MPRFANTSCSQCGKDFGPGDHGFSHCENHEQIMTDNIKTLAQQLRIWIASVRGMADQPFVRLTISEAEECADLIEQQVARIAELESHLGAKAGDARREALEEAAKICDRMVSVSAVNYETGTACAHAIRALAASEPKTGE